MRYALLQTPLIIPQCAGKCVAGMPAFRGGRVSLCCHKSRRFLLRGSFAQKGEGTLPAAGRSLIPSRAADFRPALWAGATVFGSATDGLFRGSRADDRGCRAGGVVGVLNRDRMGGVARSTGPAMCTDKEEDRHAATDRAGTTGRIRPVWVECKIGSRRVATLMVAVGFNPRFADRPHIAGRRVATTRQASLRDANDRGR